MLGQCKLCLKNNVELQMSHIVPKFVWKWFSVNIGQKRTQQKGDELMLCFM